MHGKEKRSVMTVHTIVNGEEKIFTISAGECLLEMLRREGYKGAKFGCGNGECGACVVLVDGRPVNSCLFPAARAEGKSILTIEGLGTPDTPHPLQRAYSTAGAVQCGYCTPGSILSAFALLQSHAEPTDDEIKRALDGNLCRCTGYVKVLDAVREAAREMRDSTHE
jgi:carbon-monoxide dehydrogenase small subunit